ncbi:MAG: response regulator [Ignavibacteria bacterium]|nr:response regulator [Ignavibacteria bacterium]
MNSIENIKPKVIIIDDEDALRLGVKKLLQMEGYDVSTAANGTEGIALGIKEDFDLAIIDLKMPDIDGITVLKNIREHRPNTVCFIATAYASYDSAVQATKIGSQGYIPKPFSAEELLNHLRMGYEKRKLILEADRLRADRENRLLELSFERTRLNTIINSIDDGVLVVNRDEQAVYFNASALKYLNLHEIFLGESIADILPPKIREVIEIHFDKPNNDSKSYSEQIELLPDEKLFVQATTTRIPNHDGTLAGVVLVLKNISEFKRVEFIKSQFVSMVAHELKAPIAATIGFLNLLLQSEIEISDEQKTDFLTRSNVRLSSLLSLVNDLLDISRIEMQTVVREIKEISLKDIVTDVIQLFNLDINKKNLSVIFNCEDNLPTINADFNEITRMVTNLVSNSVKYNKVGGEIKIELKENSRYIIFTVGDSGIGMKPNEKKKLFLDFFRAKNEFTKNIHGTGLGLAIVKRIVDSYSGTIEVDTEYGVGTTFRIQFPKLLETEITTTINSH